VTIPNAALSVPGDQTGVMISRELAQQLRDAGLAWRPAPGDRFIVPDRDMDDEVFIVSQMTIEAYDRPTGRVIRFNGTTEWALDTIEERNVVWLPREDQLRALLGDRFVRLEAVDEGFAVVTREDGAEQRHVDADPEVAYGWSLMSALASSPPAGLRLIRGGNGTKPGN
jgi:hypothetical protein